MDDLFSTFVDRYDRQRKVIGKEVDDKLHNTTVAVFGLGGIGSWLSEFLARMGVKKMFIIDFGIIDLPDLHRQGYTESDIGRPKVYVHYEKLKKVNSSVKYVPIFSITEDNLSMIFEESDIIFDATDNLPSRKLIDYYSKKYEKPWIFGAVSGYIGYSAIFTPKTGCFMKIFGNKQPFLNPREYGVITNTILYVIATQLSLFLKWLRGEIDENLYIINSRDLRMHKIKLPLQENCNPEKVNIEDIYKESKDIIRVSLESEKYKRIIEKLNEYLPIEQNEYYIRYSIDGKTAILFRSMELWIDKELEWILKQ